MTIKKKLGTHPINNTHPNKKNFIKRVVFVIMIKYDYYSWH